MEQIINELNKARLCLIGGMQETAYQILVDVIDELTTEEIKKEPMSHQAN